MNNTVTRAEQLVASTRQNHDEYHRACCEAGITMARTGLDLFPIPMNLLFDNGGRDAWIIPAFLIAIYLIGIVAGEIAYFL